MRNLASVVLALATALVPAGALAQTPASGRALDITFDHGLVTLVARNVTVPEIMGEWARKGGSKIINAERIVGGPVTFEFHDVPEATVLQSVLRSASGFIAAPRRAGGPTGASVMEQVMILAVSRGNASAVITMPSNPIAAPVPIMGSPDDDIPPAQRMGPQPSPQPQAPGPQSSAQPTAPMTSPTPGSVVVPPVKPGAPVQQIIKTPTASAPLLGTRTLLLNPPLVDGRAFTRQGRCQEREDVLGTTKPPLTLAWLAAGLRRIGCDVRVVDLTASRQSIDTLIDELGRAAWRPTLILFASTFPTWDADARAAAALKAATGAPVIAFGPPASASPRAALLRAPDLDGLLVGEPETAAATLAALAPDADWRAVDSLMFRRGTEILGHQRAGVFAEFETADGPDWRGVEFRDHRLPLVNAPYALVETSRGCPYTCEFCVAPIQQGHTFRARPASRIVDEIERGVRTHGLQYFYLWGDTVTLNLTAFRGVASALTARRLGIQWLANARADNLADPRFVEFLKASGCWMLSFGVESWSPDRRATMHKKLGQNAIHAAARNLRRAGILSFAFFIVGYPGETPETMARTIDFARELDVDFAGFYPAVPYPGTALGDRAAAAGWLSAPDDWSRLEYSHYAMQTPELDETAVLRTLAHARRRFYLRPGYLLRHAGVLARVAASKPALTGQLVQQMLRS